MKLLIIDGNSLMNRAFYGIRALSNSKGQFTNAVFGFMNMYLSLKKQVEPDAVAAAFDLKKPTFRHEMYSEYKAGRHAMPEELVSQMPIIKELLSYLGCRVIEKEGFEADDIIGTISAKADENNKCFIATGDRDSFQLVSDYSTVLLMTNKMGHVVYDVRKIKDDYGVTPRQMIEIKALQGDSSDNIPGVTGIGEKTAQELISKFESIDNIYKNIETLDIKPRIKEKLINDKEKAYLSRKLGEIYLDTPVETDYGYYISGTPDYDKASKLLTDLEMFSLMDRLGIEKCDAPLKDEEEEIVFEYETVTAKELEKIISEKDEAYIFFDFPAGSLSLSDGEKVYFINPMDVNYPDLVRSILESDVRKTVFDSKAVYKYGFENSVTVNNIVFDVMLGGYVADPSRKDYSPESLADDFRISKIKCENESCKNALLLKPLKEFIEKKLVEDEQKELYFDIEMPLAEVLASMEYEGFAVDREGIIEYSAVLNDRIEALKSEIYVQVGYEFNINSPKQLGEALFEELGLPAKKKTKSGYSTNAEVLESLVYAHPVIKQILEYRTFSKLKSTYCDGLLKVIDSDGRIRSTFNQTETRTGRLSSTEPNLQNIPVRTPEGKEFRKFFRAAEGKTLVDADYSQIELRVLASMAEDENMIYDFSENKDFHSATASRVFGIPEEMVNSVLRSRAKAVNFGIVYGIGAFSLAKDIGVTRKEADKYIKDYLELYSGVKNFMTRSVEDARQYGYSRTLYGRRRYLPDIAAKNGMLRAASERIAMNSPIQGTAADIIKIAMVRVYNRLKNENMKSKLIMQVHDELIVECPEGEKEKAKDILTEEMENACLLKVKLVADAGTGDTWYLAKE